MNDSLLSKEAGKCKDFLAYLKCREPEKYKMVKKMGIAGYEAYGLNVRQKLGDMYWEIKEHPDMKFSELYRRYCPDANSSRHSFMNYISKMGFSTPTTSPQLKAIRKMEYILHAFEQYKKDIKWEK